MQDKIKEDIPIMGSSLMGLHAAFNRMITGAYIEKYHVWPKCVFRCQKALPSQRGMVTRGI